MGKLKGVKLVYIGVHNNVCNSLIEGCTKTGVKLTTVTPFFNEAARDDELLAEAKKTGLWQSTLDAKKAVKDADFVYTDTWIDMEFFTDPKYAAEKEKRIKLMMPYQINAELLKGSSASIMHDMPIHRGYEISPEAIDSPKSVIFEQSENRLYSAKAIMLTLLNLIEGKFIIVQRPVSFMTLFVAFLRGINVGGHIVKKEHCRKPSNRWVFKRLLLFRQSGNVVFETQAEDTQELEKKIEEKLREHTRVRRRCFCTDNSAA